MAASVSIAFDDGSRVVSQTLKLDEGNGAEGGRDEVRYSVTSFYEIDRIVAFIADGGFRRVALQFPDELLRDSPEVTWAVEAALRRRPGGSESFHVNSEGGNVQEQPLLFVTGDTSYGSCCVDEVAAQHLGADAIVHVGRACLSPTASGVPVLYVFGKAALDVDDCVARVREGPLAGGQSAVLLYDVRYAHCMLELLEALGEEDRGRLAVGRAVASTLPEPAAQTLARGAESDSMKSPTAGCACASVGGGSGGGHCAAVPTSKTGSNSCGKMSCSGESTTAENVGEAGRESSCCQDGGVATSSGRCHGRLDDTADPALQPQLKPVTAPAVAKSAAAFPPAAPEASSWPAAAPEQSLLTSASTAAGTIAEAEAEVATETSAAASFETTIGLQIGGLAVSLASEEDLKRRDVVFLGAEGRQLSNVLLRCQGACARAWSYDPRRPPCSRLREEGTAANRHLRRRFYLTQRAREASVVGLVAGTLGVKGHADALRALRRAVEASGRKAYTLAVGRPSVAKLANFAACQVFCLVACSENSLLDAREFHAPVVTPFELEVALGLREWDGSYSTAFGDLRVLSRRPDGGSGGNSAAVGAAATALTLVEMGEGTLPRRAETSAGGTEEFLDDDGDAPFFSLVSGTYMSRPAATPGGGSDGGGSGGAALLAAGDAASGSGCGVLSRFVSPAAEFLKGQEYQGLEGRVGETEAAAAVEGARGIASDYGGV